VRFATENDDAQKQTQATGHSSVFDGQGHLLQADTEQKQFSVRGQRCRFDHGDEQACLDVHIGGQTDVNQCKLFLARKSDFDGLKKCGARNNPIKIGCYGSGFCKTLRNHRDLGVCMWVEKIYTWLILVCSGQFLVHTLFAYRENHRSNAVNLSKNTVGINVPEISDALKFYKSQKN
jgi:hypothetical protein